MSRKRRRRRHRRKVRQPDPLPPETRATPEPPRGVPGDTDREPEDLTIEVIDPERAADYLATMAPNRKPSDNAVTLIAADILHDRYLYNGDTIKFNWQGQLIDGQHRLMAVIRAGSPIRTAVARGIDPAAFTTIDNGKIRRASQILQMAGTKNATAVAGAVHHLIRHERGKLTSGGIRLVVATTPAILEWVADHTKIVDSAKIAGAATKILAHTVGAMCHYQFAERDRAAADRFFRDLAHGENLTRGEPVFALREALIADRAKRKDRLSTLEKIAITRIAWNCQRAGNPRRRLTWSPLSRMPDVMD